MDLTAAQWEKLKPLLAPKRHSDGRGRPWRDTQAVLNGVLWVLRTGAPWHDLPDRYPPYQTCHRRFQQWQRDGHAGPPVARARRRLARARQTGSVGNFHRRQLQFGEKRGAAV